MVAPRWTEQQDDNLLHRWNTLKQSTRFIGDETGFTKSAICGRLQRLRKRGCAVDIHFERNFVLRRPPKPPKPEVILGPAEPESDDLPMRLQPERVQAVARITTQIENLTSRSCRFIEGDPLKGGSFCGEDTKLGSSYCPTHHRRCWKKPDGPPIDLETFREARVIVRAP